MSGIARLTESEVRKFLSSAEDSGAILATLAPCEAHLSHAPTPTYCEVHHVIPRAWQGVWQPDVAPYPGHYDGQALWDARTKNLCRTGHGNTHFWIVQLMHAWEPGIDLAALSGNVRRAFGNHVGHAEMSIAQEALIRFLAAGGDLQVLVDAKQWGSI